MKNQYFGDINDYFKYGILRAFGRELSVAVIWMMTPDDGSNDGRKTAYLDDEERRGHDRELFDWLRNWKRHGAMRDVSMIEKSALLPTCRFFSEPVPDDVDGRAAWFERARAFAGNADLVFLDPDRGMAIPSCMPGMTGSSAYITFEELRALYEDGHALLVYQHMARVPRQEFIRGKLRQLYETFGMERFTTLYAFDWIAFLIDWDHLAATGAAVRKLSVAWDPTIVINENWIVPVPMSAEEIAERSTRAIREHIERRKAPS